MNSLTEDFNVLKQRLSEFRADGGADGCEDMQYGFEMALDNIQRSGVSDYFHFFVVIGNAPNHGDNPTMSCDYPNTHPIYNKSYSTVWNELFDRLKKLGDFKVCIIPVGGDYIKATYEVMRKPENLGDRVDKKNQISASELSSVLISETVSTYRMGIIHG